MGGKVHYEWERFWVDAEQRVAVDFEKFFGDPRDEYEWLRPRVTAKTLDELHTEPCLILLGEPGLGKSQAVSDAVRASSTNLIVDRIDLAANPDASSLRSRMTESKHWREWTESGRTLYLYLDSLDEATLHFPAIHKFLLEEFRAVEELLGRLRLRLACRSAEWIAEVADELREIWPHFEGGGSGVRELTLAPLRERDVRTAAVSEGLDGEQLLAEIREHGVEGLAALPLTLRMMLEAAKEGSGLPDSQADLYKHGVGQLLREPDSIRRKGEAPLRMEAGKRLAVAERISAAVLLSRRSGVSLQPGHAVPGDIDPAEIAGFRESDRLSAGGDLFDVGEAEILETLRTALFSTVGAERVSFSHRSLGEYCAGAYLANGGLGRGGLSRLLFAASDSEGRLVPQLREVAAWAAALDPTALEAVLESEPEVLLRIDRLALDPTQRAQVVDAILNVEPAERISRWDRRIWESLRALDHVDLPGQLNPLINDHEANWSVRRLAITIARVCERAGCEKALLDLAFAESEPAWVRDDAVWALREYGSLTSRQALIPLALESIEDDTDDEIKGSALSAVYPDLIGLEQVLPALTPPRNTHLAGAYLNFLTNVFSKQIRREELPHALAWAKEIEPTHRSRDIFADVAEGILAQAWPLVDKDEEITHLVVGVVRDRLKAHEDLLDRIYRNDHQGTFEDTAGRHRLIEELIPDIREGEMHAAAFKVSSPHLLLAEDLGWVLAQIRTALGTPDETAWIQVAGQAFAPPISESDFEELGQLCQLSDELDESLGDLFRTVRLDSPEAEDLRERFGYSRQPWEETLDHAEEIDEAIEGNLIAAEGGDKEAWWRLNYDLLFNEHGRPETRANEFDADITVLPGWKRSAPSVQARIASLARPVLDGEPPDPQDWFGKSVFNRAAFGGYRALHLLAKLDRGSFDLLPTSVWERWMSIVIDAPRSPNSDTESTHDLIMQRAAETAGRSFANWTKRKLTSQAEADDGNLFFLHRLDELESPEVTGSIVSMLADESLRPKSLRDLLDYSLPREPGRSYELTVPRIQGARCEFESEGAREAAVVCSAKLLALVPGLGYSDVMGFLRRCPALGKDVILGVAREERTALSTDLTDQELGDLVAWIFEYFPEAEDPPLEEGWVSPRESLLDFRLWLLDALAERGTDHAVGQISAIYENDERTRLRFSLRKARDARRAKSPAPSPGEVVRLVHGGDSTPRTQADLLARVLAALDSIQSSLQVGQPPAAPELWNTRPGYTPKDEGDLSNWLSGRLSQSLGTNFDVARERLVSGGSKGRGKSVDLQVVCPAPEGSPNALQLLIEVKGCWERDLIGKIHSQLAADYMETTGIREAIFLLFWFGAERWEKSDDRRRRCAFESVEEARRELTAKAREIGAVSDLRIEAVVFDASLR